MAVRLWLSVLLFVCSGASCPRLMGRGGLAGPVLLAPGATLEQLLSVVNQPGERVRQLRTVGARLNVENAPGLSAEMALERPRNLRLTAKLGVSLSSEPEIDLGSNQEQYWMWVRREETLFVGRHGEPMTGIAGQLLPVPPDWLTEVLGLVTLTPQDIVAGPTPLGGDRLTLNTRLPGRPDLLRILEIDAQRGHIVRQHLYDVNHTLLASSEASDFRYVPEHGVSLPHRIAIQLPLVPSRLQLDTSSYLINQLPTDSRGLWQLPNTAAQRVELTSPDGPRPSPMAAPPVRASPDPSPSPALLPVSRSPSAVAPAWEGSALSQPTPRQGTTSPLRTGTCWGGLTPRGKRQPHPFACRPHSKSAENACQN